MHEEGWTVYSSHQPDNSEGNRLLPRRHKLPPWTHHEKEKSTVLEQLRGRTCNFKSPQKEISRPDGFIGEFCQMFKEKLIPYTSSRKQKGVGGNTNLFYKVSVTLIPKPDKDTTKKNRPNTRKRLWTPKKKKKSVDEINF